MENFTPQVQAPTPEKLENRQAFLSSIKPFNLLPKAEIKTIAANLNKNTYPRDYEVFVQEQSIVTRILILRNGRMEKTITDHDGSERREIIDQGGIYGSISILFNNCISSSTVRCLEKSTVYELDRKKFLLLCVRHRDFVKNFSTSLDEVRQDLSYEGVGEPIAIEELGQGDAFLWEPAGNVTRDFPSCPGRISIREATELMTATRRSAILVLDPKFGPVGLITDSDLRRKVIMEGLSYEADVERVMSTPLIQVDAELTIFDSILLMMRHQIKHLVVFQNNRLKGMITERDLCLLRTHSPILIIHKLQTAADKEELKNVYAKLPAVISNLISSGARTNYLNAIITVVMDTILTRIIDMALKALGPPPAAL